MLYIHCLFVQIGWALTHYFAGAGDHARLLWLLRKGAEVDAIDRVGVTPLFLAAAKV